MHKSCEQSKLHWRISKIELALHSGKKAFGVTFRKQSVKHTLANRTHTVRVNFMKSSCCYLLLCASVTLLSVGCKPAGDSKSNGNAPVTTHDHDHGHSGEHQHPESLLEGLQQLSDAYMVIKNVMEKGDADAAHGPLHDIAHLLEEDLPGLTQKSDLGDDVKSKLTASWNGLFDQFGKLDGFFHGGPKVEWADLDKQISPIMEELKGLIK